MGLFRKLGTNSVSELPQIPSNLEVTPIVGGITLNWNNNNTNVTGTTNVSQLLQNNTWIDKTELPSTATTNNITGLSQTVNYNVRVAVKSNNLYYPSATRIATILEPPKRPDFAVQVNTTTLRESIESNAFNVFGAGITIASWFKTNEWINTNGASITRSSELSVRPFWFGITNSRMYLSINNNFPQYREKLISSSINTWYFMVIRNYSFNIYSESGLVASFSSGYANANSSPDWKLSLGNPSNTAQHNATYQSVGTWNRRLSDEEELELWNNGLGMSYANLSTSLKVSLTDWLDCDDWDGTKIISSVNGVQLTNGTGGGTITRVAR